MTRLLLHACCAPCSLEPVRLLVDEGFDPTICWTNPNIQPAEEHDRRLAELRRWCAGAGIPLIEAREDSALWERGVAAIGARDRERRCRACYALRLAEACRVAEAKGFSHIATTLAVSPYQLFDTCNDVLEHLAAAHGLTPVIRDFRPWYPEATRRSSSACTASSTAAAASRPQRPRSIALVCATSASRRTQPRDAARRTLISGLASPVNRFGLSGGASGNKMTNA